MLAHSWLQRWFSHSFTSVGTVSITVGPPRPHTGLGWLTRILAWTDRYFFQAPFEEGATRQAIQQGQVLWPQDKAKAEPGAILLEQMTPVT